MHQHRTVLLMALLLGLLGYYFFQVQPAYPVRLAAQKAPPPLEGENEIRAIRVFRAENGDYGAQVEYHYRGEPWPALMRIYPVLDRNENAEPANYSSTLLSRGVHQVDESLVRAYISQPAHSTHIVRVEMLSTKDKKVFLRKDLEYPIDWPRLPYAVGKADSEKDIPTLYREAVAEIDFSSRESLKNARSKLERIAEKDPRFVPAYPEMARYQMKTNWGPEGLRQGEQTLKAGLAIDPEHANSHVLIGYVYAHQGRYAEARAAFARAREIGTDNLWLWANWGELHLMQGQLPQAIAMYEKALATGRTYDTYDRARKDAYRHLIDIHRLAKAYDKADALHRKRIEEYPSENCYPYRYADFLLRYRNDADQVLTHAKRALNTGCAYQAQIRKVIGSAYYAKWQSAESPEQADAYRAQARLHFPEGPVLLYWLARSDRTATLIDALVADGISIDVTDNTGLTALAHAVHEQDTEAMQRLIERGADPAARIGKQKIPLLALAVLSNDLAAVELLLKNGADADAPVYGGATLAGMAEGMGYSDIAELLKNAAGKRI